MSVISRTRWKRFKQEIESAFENWYAWSGGQGDWEDQDEFEAMVKKSHNYVKKILAEIESKKKES